MRIEGVTLHSKCGGLGIIEKDGKGEICIECMGTGMVTGISEDQLPEIHVVRRNTYGSVTKSKNC